MNSIYFIKLLKLLKLILPNYFFSLLTRISCFFLQNVKSSKGVIFDFRNKFEGSNILLDNVEVYQSEVGKYTYVAPNSIITCAKIGRYTSIGAWVKIGVGKHPTNYVSTHPLFYSSIASHSLGLGAYEVGEKYEIHKLIDSYHYVIIGSDVWIGDRVLIMDGVTIGDGAIIGAGSIVTKNVKAYEIVAGVPAKHIRYRFTPKEINFLLDFKWWNKDERWIKKNANNFDSISKLYNYKKEKN